MQKPVRPIKKHEYLKIGEEYVTPIDTDIIEVANEELDRRIEIVPYTSMGERDTLGLNTIECLETLKKMLEEAQLNYKDYEEICDAIDEEEYQKEMREYREELNEYNKWLDNNHYIR